MLGRTDSRLRLVALLGVFAVIATLLGARLAYWQLGQGPELRRVADTQQQRPAAEQEVRRGDITDRNGNVLATTAYRDLLAAYPDEMSEAQKQQTAATLGTILGFDSQQQADLLASFGDDDSAPQYLIIDRQLTSAQSDAVRAGLAARDLVQVGLEPHPVRFYPSAGGSPSTTLASQLLGFVTQDGVGRYGVEQASQSVLAGAGSATADSSDTAPLPAAGGSIQLTIDAGLQLRLEKELLQASVADRAPRVSAVVMDPYTGAILAWGSVPGYDENNYGDIAQDHPDYFTDPISSEVYEPGSVMKMFTAAAALEEGVIGLHTPVQDSKALVFGDTMVQNFDKKSMGLIQFEDAIAHSRNVATGKVALMLGPTTDEASHVLYEMWTRLGIGEPTGIELGGEAAGLVADPSDTRWQAIDLVNRAFGQALAITPLQLVRAFAAMANGGKLVQPHIYASDDATAQANVQQVLSPALSETLRELMIHVVDEGPNYAEETKIPGYVVGGKTGTAQIWDSQAGGWLADTYNHTFVGFVGNERPEAIILVRIHDTVPRVPEKWGMSLEMTSNELWRHVALDTISELDLQPVSDGSPPSQIPTIDPSADPADTPPPPKVAGLPAIYATGNP